MKSFKDKFIRLKVSKSFHEWEIIEVLGRELTNGKSFEILLILKFDQIRILIYILQVSVLPLDYKKVRLPVIELQT